MPKNIGIQKQNSQGKYLGKRLGCLESETIKRFLFFVDRILIRFREFTLDPVIMRTYLAFILVIYSLSANAQRPIIVDGPVANWTLKDHENSILKRQQNKWNKMQVSVHKPPMFKEIRRELPVPCNTSSSTFTFIKNDSTVLITISLFDRDSLDYNDDVAFMKKHRPFHNYKPNDQWITNFKGSVDSTNVKPVFYCQDRLKQYNADDGVEFLSLCPRMFLDKYQLAKTIVLNKKFHGIIEIHYFTRQNSKIQIIKEIENGARMVRFNN